MTIADVQNRLLLKAISDSRGRIEDAINDPSWVVNYNQISTNYA